MRDMFRTTRASLLAVSLLLASFGCGGGGGDDPDAGAADATAAVDATDLDAPRAVDAVDAPTCATPALGTAAGTLVVTSAAALTVDCLRVVGFDDIDTAAEAEVAFEPDRYLALGIRIAGEDGQYADETFGYPADFIPTSAPNSYAPGPAVANDSAAGSGGNTTTITFEAGGAPANVAAFGASFIDADIPAEAITRVEAFDAADLSLGFDEPSSASGTSTFRGLVAVDGGGAPVTAIAKVVITTGAGWPNVALNEGVTLDDFTFAPPLAR